VSLVCADVSATLPQIRAGKVRGLGLSSVKRAPPAPEMPVLIVAAPD